MLGGEVVERSDYLGVNLQLFYSYTREFTSELLVVMARLSWFLFS